VPVSDRDFGGSGRSDNKSKRDHFDVREEGRSRDRALGGWSAIVAARIRGKIKMRPRLLLLVAILSVALSIGGASLPEQTVWSGLIIATNSPPTEPTPAEVTQIEGTLRKLFGYSQFQLIGEARKTLKTDEEYWLA